MCHLVEVKDKSESTKYGGCNTLQTHYIVFVCRTRQKTGFKCANVYTVMVINQNETREKIRPCFLRSTHNRRKGTKMEIKEQVNSVEGMCCDCLYAEKIACMDFTENLTCEHRNEDGTCWTPGETPQFNNGVKVGDISYHTKSP